jgi:hypothetical protein
VKPANDLKKIKRKTDPSGRFFYARLPQTTTKMKRQKFRLFIEPMPENALFGTMKTSYIILCLGLIFCSNRLTAEDKISLSFNPGKGDSLVYTLSIKIHTKVSSKDGVYSQKMIVDIAYDMVCREKTDSFMTLDFVYRRMATWAEIIPNTNDAASQKTVFSVDTDNDPDEDEDKREEVNKLYKLYRLFVGNGFQVSMTNSGKVLALNGITELKEQLLERIRKDWAETASYETMRGTIEQNLDEESLKTNFENSFGFYPAKPVGEGDHWEKSMDMKVADTRSKGTVTYTFKGMKNDSIAIIDLVMPYSANSTSTNLKLKGTQTGTVDLNVKTGLMNNYSSSLNMTGKTKTDAGNFGVDVTSDIEYGLKKKKKR